MTADRTYKLICYIGCLAFAIMFVMAWYWWELRTAFTDCAFLLFWIVKDDQLQLQHNRFSDFIMQSFPLFASRLNLSLTAVAKLYSVSFVLFQFSVFATIAFVLKDVRIATVLLLFNVMMVTDTFYYVPGQLTQGIAWMLLGFSLLRHINQKNLKWSIPLTSLVLLTTAFAHPLMAPVFLFAWIYLCLLNSQDYKRRQLIWCGAFFYTAYIVKKLFFHSWYDNAASENLKHFQDYFPDYWLLDTNVLFANASVKYYHWMVLAFIGVNVFYIFNRRWRSMILLAVFCAGYLLMVNVVSANTGIQRFYAEGMYLPLSFFVALPIVFELMPLMIDRRLALPFVGLMVMSFTERIYRARIPYEQRRDWLVEAFELHPNEKLIIPMTQVPMDTLLMTWATPYEWWLITTTRYNETAHLMIHDNPDIFKEDMNKSNVWFAHGKAFLYSEFPKRYFIFKDSVTTYRVYDDQ